MAAFDWILFIFLFIFGCCIGSFLNVVIYRLPRDKSLVKPPSACPVCDEYIRFYDNIPLISWLILGAKCRYCKSPISPRYFVIELLTGVVFAGLFYLYFFADIRTGLDSYVDGKWFIYLLHITLLAVFIAASAIDLELWIIPLSVCWFVMGVGLIGSCVGVYVIDPIEIRGNFLLPSASANSAVMAFGAAVGLIISLLLLVTGLIKRSYEFEGSEQPFGEPENASEQPVRHRLEVCREIIFLLPIIICSVAALAIKQKSPTFNSWWVDFSQNPAVAGFLGSLWGYFVGCGVVWATRILGTLAFGKEAMGLGDVHLMGAAGTIIGPVFIVIAFFVAPFFGLGWAGFQMFFKKIRQIPYGPFLSLGVFTVMILHDWIFSRLVLMFYNHG